MKNHLFHRLLSVIALAFVGILLSTNTSSASTGTVLHDASSYVGLAPDASTPSNPNCNGCTYNRTDSITLSWSTTGTSANVHIWGGPSIDINPGASGCCSISLGSQWPGSYNWQVTAHGGGDTTGPQWSFKVKPYGPTNLSASAAGSSQINLNWTKSSDDPGSVDSYNVYMNGSYNKNVGSGSTSTSVGGLNPSTNYSFTLRAVRQGVESNDSNSASATTSAPCYTLTMNVNPGGTGNVGANPSPNCGSQYNSGTTVTLTANPNSGYHFKDWAGSAAGSSNPTSVNMSSDKSVTANFEQDCYSLTTNVNPGASGSVNAGPAPNCPTDGTKYASGTVVTLTANPNSGYSFTSWSGDASGSANPTTVTMSANRNVTANFTQPCYSLTTGVNPGGAGSVGASPTPNCPTDGTKYASGTVVTLTANPNTGYSFTSWSGDASGSANPTTVNMSIDRNVTANFGSVMLAIVPNTKTVGLGQNFDLVVQVQAGTQPIDGGAAYINFDPTNLNVVALTPGSALPTILANTFDNTAGHVDFAAGILTTSYPSGTFTLVTVTFSPLTSTSGTSVVFNGSNPRKADVTYAGASVLASTTPGTVIVQQTTCYSLTTSVNPGGTGSVGASPSPNCPTDGTKYASGTVVTLTANPNSGYSFTSWSGDTSGSSNPTTVTMSTNRNVTANFTSILTCGAGIHLGTEWVNFYSAHTTFDGASVPLGACVEAYAGSIKIGSYVVDTTGNYGFLAAYKDDPTTPAKDGATPGDAITFTINGYAATPTGAFGGVTNPTWTANGNSVQVDLAGMTKINRTIPLSTNWNLISYDLWPMTGTQVITNPATVLQPIAGQYIKVLGFDPTQGGLTYDPALPQFSTLKSLDPWHGYWINATSTVPLTLEGQEVSDSSPISLATNWNLVSYLPNASEPVTVALGSINGQYARVLGFDPIKGGLTYDPLLPQFSNLKNLDPLRGYWINMTIVGTLVYPSSGGTNNSTANSRLEAIPANQPKSNQAAPTLTCGAGIHQSTEWVNFYSAHTTFNGALVPVGACVEAWDGSIKVGYYIVDTSGSYGFLAVYRDDPTTPAKDGALPGDVITFGINGYHASPTGVYGGITNSTWTANGDTLQVDLVGSTSPTAVRLTSLSAQATYGNGWAFALLGAVLMIIGVLVIKRRPR